MSNPAVRPAPLRSRTGALPATFAPAADAVVSDATAATAAGRRRPAAARTPGDAPEAALPAPRQHALADELCSVLVSPLRRSDQRRKGASYVDGLLRARGRKSIRNIASAVGGPADEQSLHHFIASSPWDWAPVRRALAEHLTRIAPPRAWVLRPMVIPKAGENSVGVDRRFVPSAGQVLNAQHASGVWAAAPGLSYPVNWRLHLPEAWLEDPSRRDRAAIPADRDPETAEDCAAESYLEAVPGWTVPDRPVLADAREGNPVRLLTRLAAGGTRVMLRIGASVPLLPITAARPGTRPAPCRTAPVTISTAQRIAETAGLLRRPVRREDGTVRMAATVPVRVPALRGAGPLTLLAVGTPGGGWPEELWLTTMNDVQPFELVRLAELVERVDADFAGTALRVGIRDFAGRSFAGWHRHTTLASAAHAILALTRPAEEVEAAAAPASPAAAPAPGAAPAPAPAAPACRLGRSERPGHGGGAAVRVGRAAGAARRAAVTPAGERRAHPGSAAHTRTAPEPARGTHPGARPAAASHLFVPAQGRQPGRPARTA
jgi:SRSO17 transposase